MSLYIYGQEEDEISGEGPGYPQFTDEEILDIIGPPLEGSEVPLTPAVPTSEFEGVDPVGYVRVNFSLDASKIDMLGSEDLPSAGTFPIYPAGDGFAVPLKGTEGNVTGPTPEMAATAFLDSLTSDERVVEITDFSVERL
jgi:hypothetical protein